MGATSSRLPWSSSRLRIASVRAWTELEEVAAGGGSFPRDFLDLASLVSSFSRAKRSAYFLEASSVSQVRRIAVEGTSSTSDMTVMVDSGG